MSRKLRAFGRAIGAIGLVALATSVCIGGAACRKDSAEQKALLARVVTDTMPPDVTPLEVNFDNKIRIVGYSLSPKLGTYPVGSGVTVTLIWRCDETVGSGWRLFTHAVGPNNELGLNLDEKGPLRRGSLPPSDWERGHYYRDELTFTIPPDAPPSLTIAPGLVKDGARMPIVSGSADGESRGRIVTLITNGRESGARVIKELDAPHLRPGDVITIDGNLDEDAWSRGKGTGPFVDVGSGRPATNYPTQGRASLMWDDQFMYVGFDVHDKQVHGGWPASFRDAGSPEPHLWEKDTVEVMVDPDGDGDNKDYYEIQINPQNLVFDTQYDGYNSPNGNGKGPFGHEEWSAKLTSAVVVHGTLDADTDHDEGYTVEAKIPWASFTKAEHAPPRPGDTWRMNFYAMKNNGGTAWSPILGMGNFHRASRFGRVKWVTGS